MAPLSIVHTALGATALVTGALVLARRKGDRAHRIAGRVYAVAIGTLCILSFGLRDSTPFFRGFGPFHIAALISLATVIAGVFAIRTRHPNWLEAHYMWMAWSYIGLVMATGGHVMQPVFLFFLRDVGLPVGLCWALAIGLVWGVPPFVGSQWIARRQPGWDALSTRRSSPEATS